ncbi:MAG: hypothetical protein AAFV07_10585 [Bacteroidota bacterium]
MSFLKPHFSVGIVVVYTLSTALGLYENRDLMLAATLIALLFICLDNFGWNKSVAIPMLLAELGVVLLFSQAWYCVLAGGALVLLSTARLYLMRQAAIKNPIP